MSTTSAEENVLLAIRHGPIAAAEGVCYGRHDWPVDDAIIEQQVKVLANDLPGWPLLCSPLQRCRALSERLGDWLARPSRVEPRLIELDFGQWEGCAWTQIEPSALDLWAAQLSEFRDHGGESLAQLLERVGQLIADTPRPVIWITHAGVIRALHHLLGGMPLQAAAEQSIDYLRPYQFQLPPRQQAATPG